MRDKIQKIIDAGIHAPSGDNCQPWSFQVSENKISVFLIEEADTSLYSWGHRASLLAMGACLENMFIASSALDLNCDIKYFSYKNTKEPVAVLTLTPGIQNLKPKLFEAVFERCTNRKKYNLNKKPQEYIHNLTKTLTPQTNYKSEVKFITQEKDKKILGKAAAANEKVLFENQHMHNFFYSHINWSASEELKNKKGFYIKTLEIPTPALPGFKLAKHWKVMKFLASLGFANFIAKQNSSIYETSYLHGLITTPGNTESDYMNAGRMLERIWLEATSLKLSFQVLTGICFLHQRIKNLNPSGLSPKHEKIIEESYANIKTIFSVKNEEPILMFRVGDGGEPSARTLREPAKIIYK